MINLDFRLIFLSHTDYLEKSDSTDLWLVLGLGSEVSGGRL